MQLDGDLGHLPTRDCCGALQIETLRAGEACAYGDVVGAVTSRKKLTEAGIWVVLPGTACALS